VLVTKTTFAAKVKHEPPTHAWLAVQVAPAPPPPFPHAPVAPQYVGLLLGSMHVPAPAPHFKRPPPQTQEPEVHTCPIAEQLMPCELPGDPSHNPAAPQCVASVDGATQLPPQLIWPEGQETAQAPLLHNLPVSAQFSPSLAPWQLPTAPQYVWSDDGLMHAAPHAICPPGQPHVPPVQIAPVPTVVPQAAPAEAPLHAPEAPQCVALVCGSTQTPPHEICEPGQLTWHAPATHILPVSEQSSPMLTPAQLPEAPQYVRLVLGSMQAPPQAT
jgi:hypothetical protein